MTSGPPSGNPVRELRILGLTFFGAVVAMFGVLLALSSGWDAADDDLARIGTLLAGVVGTAGLAATVWWRNRVQAAPVAPGRLRTSWFLVVAIAEAGMLVGFVFALLSRSLVPFIVGGTIFAIGLLLVTGATGEVELEG